MLRALQGRVAGRQALARLLQDTFLHAGNHSLVVMCNLHCVLRQWTRRAGRGGRGGRGGGRFGVRGGGVQRGGRGGRSFGGGRGFGDRGGRGGGGFRGGGGRGRGRY